MGSEAERVVQLLAEAVPEVAAGQIEIMAVARLPGSRCKLALRSRDAEVDCIAACVGARGERIKRVVDALRGERVDLVRWDDSPERLIASALQPAIIERVVLDGARRRAAVVVAADQRALAEGPRGENRALAGDVCGWHIDLHESQET